MSYDDVAIKVENLSKCYEIYPHPQNRLKQIIYPALQKRMGLAPKTYYEPFWALKDISFEVKRGQSVGIIGQNGSGKSTLLQLITGILKPTQGSIDVKGRVAALIELGSGFNPEFTGRENVYLNASILGLSKEETDSKFDQIAAFADIGEHLEHAVKTYSSGMMMRLAFAVQMAVEPDVLIIDEALGVGDAKFQLKCFKRLEELKLKGTTILFVSHSIDLVKTFCDKGLLLHCGHSIYWGDTITATTKYYEILFPKNNSNEKFATREMERLVEPKDFNSRIIQRKSLSSQTNDMQNHTISLNSNDLKTDWGTGGAILTQVEIKGLKHPNILVRESQITFFLHIQLNHQIIHNIAEKGSFSKNLFVGIRLDNFKGISIFDIFHEINSHEMSILEKENKTILILSFELEVPELCQGNYFATFGIAIGTVNTTNPLFSCDNAIMLTIEPHSEILGQLRPKYKSYRIV